MTSHELVALERALGITLPAAYRATMERYPFAPDSEPAEWSLPDDAARIEALNLQHRRMQFRSGPWPETAFVIGEDGGEVAYVLDLARTPAVVQEFSLETGQFTDRTADWSAWLAELAAEQRELAADQAAMSEAYRRKKWWQFWIRPVPHD